MNFVRKHALAYQAKHGCDLETAALRVFGNAEGAYGSNVNHLVDSGRWDDEDELAETYTRRKGFAYGRAGRPVQQTALLQERAGRRRPRLPEPRLGRARRHHRRPLLRHAGRHQPRGAARQRAQRVPVYIGDQTRGDGKVRTLAEQVALETRTRMLNPKWYEGMLKHGYEGVRQIEAHVTNTMGWSATTGQVAALGLPAADRRPSCSTPRCASAWRSSTRRPRPRWPTACSKRTSATTGQPDAAMLDALRQRRRRTRRPARRRRS